MRKYTPQEITDILSSLATAKIFLDKEGELDVRFADMPDIPNNTRGFEYSSFTREVLELIEEALTGPVQT